MDPKDNIIQMQKQMIELLQEQIKSFEKVDENNTKLIKLYRDRCENLEEVVGKFLKSQKL